MNLLTSCVAIPLVVLGITISNMSTPVSGKKLEITIANDLGNFLNLTVHCVSPAKEYDLGFQVVPYGGRRDNRRCKGWCFWRIAQEGLYLHLAKPADRDELEFTWD
ncbi:hypothetical protein FEM48_Zijuj07G0076700 [Ziziphus jujuba var. spinosa]|uniref:S-protein homolog n=1 Tax=Ziziphus jujuba var. spinosa TaxID=714518 RepID=A0A978V3C6_ZIZJJ|nr:hypothetical protein FEM48_Zijuj07G0076700 [Ziziphus jujuba var. spinosa]